MVMIGRVYPSGYDGRVYPSGYDGRVYPSGYDWECVSEWL